MTTDLIATQFAYTHFVIRKNTEGVTQEDSLFRPQPAGNCVNWVLGHILASRNGLLRVLGEETFWTQEQENRYRRGSAPLVDGNEALPFEEMLRLLDASQETVVAAIKGFDPERLGDPAPISPVGNPDETMGSLFAALAFHEAYHAGQTGVIRRVMGKEGALQ